MSIPKIEKKSLPEIKKFQEGKLKDTLSYLKNNSRFYQRLFKENNIVIEDILTLEDLTKIPVTTKNDLQKYTDDFLCVDKNKIIDYVTTSGTMGEP